jgi:hypothetical protein
MAKTNCPITRAEFTKDAKAVEIIINGVPLMAEVKEFSTGSLGWYLNGKTTIRIADKPVSVQIGLNLTIVGSKELPKEGP